MTNYITHITRDEFKIKPFTVRVTDTTDPNPWSRNTYRAFWTLRGAQRWAKKHAALRSKTKKGGQND